VVGVRNVSTVPTQALFLMNDPFVKSQADAAAEQLLKRDFASDQHRIGYVFRQTLGRSPSARELELTIEFLRGEVAVNRFGLKTDQEVESSKTGLVADDASHAGAERTKWAQLYHALFSSLDFRYVD
jgi:Protein of unknown function (DUF1553)